MKLCKKHDHSEFLKPVAVPHVLSLSSISDDVLDEFIKNQGDFFLGLPNLMQKLDVKQHLDNATQAVSRANHFALKAKPPDVQATFKNCALVWDTGASFGLSPFRGDFIDYI